MVKHGSLLPDQDSYGKSFDLEKTGGMFVREKETWHFLFHNLNFWTIISGVDNSPNQMITVELVAIYNKQFD